MTDGKRLCSLIVGAPGSGKGTISNWIVRDFGLVHVSSGDLLRQHVRGGTEVGKLAKQVIVKVYTLVSSYPEIKDSKRVLQMFFLLNQSTLSGYTCTYNVVPLQFRGPFTKFRSHIPSFT